MEHREIEVDIKFPKLPVGEDSGCTSWPALVLLGILWAVALFLLAIL